ncbi:MAG TPA: hypothetical protein VK148_01490 [Xanthobacteraceae bacterium]|jgi:hypothetical protein|nr:hypothetical protein [Xanthobacteraceae bacterium]
MTSIHQIMANRANALKSTGPKTSAGKARASQNALRHGCESLALWAGGYAEEIEVLARTMAGNDVSGGRFAQARRIAAAQLDLARVRQMKLDLQTAANFGSVADGLDRTVRVSPDWNLLVPISKLERYEQRARARRRRAIREFDTMLPDATDAKKLRNEANE